MPIANCIVTPECQNGAEDLVRLWAKESGQSEEHMTINIVVSSQQLGNRYAVMATLILPSLWSAESVSSLQIGLSKALSVYFKIPLEGIFITTNIVESGCVVSNGEEEVW